VIEGPDHEREGSYPQDHGDPGQVGGVHELFARSRPTRGPRQVFADQHGTDWQRHDSEHACELVEKDLVQVEYPRGRLTDARENQSPEADPAGPSVELGSNRVGDG